MTGKLIDGGTRMWLVDTNYYKDKIHRLVNEDEGADGDKWKLHAGVSEDYKQQFLAEHKALVNYKRTGEPVEIWKTITRGAANHFLDCEVYATAAAEMLGIQHVTDDQWAALQTAEANRASDQARAKREEELRGADSSWIEDTEGW